MKTSVIEVRDMLSVLSVDAVEKRIGEVPGIESVTVNYAAGNATVRFDETHIEVGDIKAAVRQSRYESDGEGNAEQGSELKPAHEPAAAPTPKGGSAPMPATAASKPPADAPATAPTPSSAPPPAAAKPVPDAHPTTPGAPADDSKPDKGGPKAESPTPVAA
jgi:Cu2+-exporting ATPase